MQNKYKLLQGLQPIIYPTIPLHMVYGDDNIGDNGENLSIIVLSCQRAQNTIKLMKSIQEHIPNFLGELIIGDNGSNIDTLNSLNDCIKDLTYKCRLVEFGQNFGVAKGRNMAINQASKEYIMNVDNDIYFTMNLLPEIHNTFSQFGCHFLNLPLISYDKENLFAIGGTLFASLSDGFIHSGCGGSFMPDKCKPNDTFERSLCTFLFGGASVMKKSTFFDCGAFDEGMFVGFEDLDLSIAIFKKGLKIGCIGVAGLIHDHKMPVSDIDKDYEKERFSNKNIYESAMYFEKKHGFKVWNKTTEEWLKEKEEQLGISSKKFEVKEVIKKPKIALLVDVHDWCYDNIAKQIIKNISDEFDFDIIYMSDDLGNDIVKISYLFKDYDLIHFFWRGVLNFIDAQFFNQYLQYYGNDIEAFKNNYIRSANITTSVYDHKFIDNDEIDTTKHILEYVHEYTVSSDKLFKIYNSLDIKKPKVKITDGVDLNIFKPKNLERFDNIRSRKLIVGWVGNSDWLGDEEKADIKGVNTIIKPAINELIAEGYQIEMYFADKKECFIPHKDIADYYHKIDVYVNASLHEGTPNPVLEAMACGIAIISTDVGIVPEVLGKKAKKYILLNRCKDELKDKLKIVIQNPDVLKDLSKEGLEQIKNWDWKQKCSDFRMFFRQSLTKGKVE